MVARSIPASLRQSARLRDQARPERIVSPIQSPAAQ